MKVLIDENLPRKLGGHLKGHECRTVAECGWAGKKNGELLSLAEPQFDVLLTAFSHRQAEGARSRANRSGVMAAFCEKRKIVIS
jgi:hypothetical protein